MATTSRGLQQVGVQAVVLDAQQFAQLSKDIEKHIDGMNTSSKRLAKEGSDSFQKFSDVGIRSLAVLTTAITGAYLALQLLGGVNFLGAAASIEQGLAVVQSVSQGTEVQLGALRDVVENLARTTVASFNDILAASAELARGGIQIEDQLGGALKSVINLSVAAAGELPFDKAARAIASAVTIFGLSGAEADRAANAFTVAAQQSAASFNDIIRSFQQVAPLAPLLKIPIEDIAAAVGVLGKAGLRGSDAGTSLKQAFIQLLTPTKKAAELMKKYEISLFDAAGAHRPLGDLLQDLNDKFGDGAVKAKKITEAERAHALATIFGADAIRSAALVAINGTESFFEMKNAMEQGTFTAKQLADIISAPLQSQLKILGNNANALATDIGNGLIPIIRTLVVELIKAGQAAAPFAKAIGDALNFAFTGTGFDELRTKLSDLFGSQLAASILSFVTSVQAAIQSIIVSFTGLLGAIQKFGGSANNVDALTQTFYDMANAVANVGVAISLGLELLANLVTLATENEDAFNNLKIALLSVVAAAVVAAFVGLVAVLITLASTFSSILIPMLAIGAAGGALVAIFASLNKSSSDATQGVADLDQGVQELIQTLPGQGDLTVDIDTATAMQEIVALTGDIEKIPDPVIEPTVDVEAVLGDLEGLATNTDEIFSAIADASIVEPTVDTKTYKTDAANLVKITETLINNVISVIERGVQGAVDGIYTYIRNILNQIVTFANVAANIVITALNATGVATSATIDGLQNKFNEMANSVVESTRISLPRVDLGNIADTFEGIGNAVAGVSDRIERLRVELPSRFVPAVTGASNALRRAGEEADRTKGSMDGFGGPGGTGKAKKGAKEAEEAIVGFTQALEKAIRLQSFIDAFGDIGAHAIDALVEAMVSNIDKDGAKAAEALHKFKQLLRTENVPDWMELGQELDQAFAQTLLDRSDVVLDAAKEVVSRAAAAAKAQGELTVATFQGAFGLGMVANQLGSQGAKLMTELKKAITEGGTDVVRAVGASAADIIDGFVKNLNPDKAKDFTDRFMDAIINAIRDKSPEATANLQDVLRSLNFDVEVAKLTTTFDKAVKTAVKTQTDALSEIARKTVESLNNLHDEHALKVQADAEKQMLRDVADLHLEVLKSVQDHEKQARQDKREDLRQELEDERAAADLKLSREEQLADAIKAKRKRLNDALKGTAPTKEEQAAGHVIQGNTNPQEDEIKALEAKWKREDTHAAIDLARRNADRAERRANVAADYIFELDQKAAFEEAKKLIEAPIKQFEKDQAQIAFDKQIADIIKAADQQVLDNERTKKSAIDNAKEVFDDAMAKLTLQKTLADSVFEGMLTDLRNINTELDKFDNVSFKVDISRNGTAAGADQGSKPATISSVSSRESVRPNATHNSSVVNNVSYQVNPTYTEPQKVGGIMLDMQALVALTS